MKLKFLLSLAVVALLNISGLFAQKPIVWIISDGNDSSLTKPDGSRITDPDDVSALASYLLMSNHFETKGIVIASTHHDDLLSKYENQADWANRFFGGAYAKDLPNLNKEIGGFQESIPFYESCLKNNGEKYDSRRVYKSLDDYSSVKMLFDLVDKSNEIVNVLCWGTLTEPAILVNYCKNNNRYDILNKVRFISHWTNSSLHTGTKEHPERVHNAFNDASSAAYIKTEALNGTIKFYECGAIGQYGIVEGAPRGRDYYEQFRSSYLGEIFINGKYVKGKEFVDGSDCATFWALLGNWGVSLNDIASNGTNYTDIEQRNEKAFFEKSHAIHAELLRRSRVAAGAVANPVTNYNLFPGHGMTDGHLWIENGRLYIFGGCDKSWDTVDTWRMYRWEIWSTDNLIDWRYENFIDPKDTYIGDKPNCWAGDIMKRDNKFYWYFSNQNTDSGVAVSDSIAGKYIDPLKKPLLPEDIIKGNPYDPELYTEDDKYYIIFSAGTYYISELKKNMTSLKTKPEPIVVVDENGNKKSTQDKSSLFKRNGIYYLVWGYNYAMSDNLKGPYTYKGNFMSGGHTSIIEWQNQWYVVQENKDLSLFFRGLALKPIYFDRDGTIMVPTDDIDYPGAGRKWSFESNAMGWREIKGTTLVHNTKAKTIGGKISGTAIIESCTWLLNETKNLSKVKVELKNGTTSSQMKIAIASYDIDDNRPKGTKWWDSYQTDWSKEFSALVDIKPNNKEFIEYELQIPTASLKTFLKALQIEPAVGATSGNWEVRSISVE